MAAKKKKAKKTAPAKKSLQASRGVLAARSVRPPMLEPPPWLTDADCDIKRVCEYINGADGTGNNAGLRSWLKWFIDDYKKLRRAVCNVEKQAFTQNGINSQPPKFCSGGGGTEPADPRDPPVW